MWAAIENPASCEVRSMIRFLLAKNLKSMEIYRQVSKVYGNNIMNESSIRKWCIQFKNGRTSVHDEEKSGRPSIVTDELVAKVDEKIRENRRFTITDHNKGQRTGEALTFLEAYDRHGDSLLDQIVTGDETWVRHVNCETKL
ncbi:protein GVQW3-like [Stegodyphus dumicola]|uniref:protein GVQW3-like n=1 Tax=Stegodyphus dumicola TaxID=202533 RepID=UPI0015AE3935|nr:protein GVQW3-like [Stegodyphus dumicola]